MLRGKNNNKKVACQSYKYMIFELKVYNPDSYRDDSHREESS